MADKKNIQLSKDEIIAKYNKNAAAGDYQPEEVADIATANTSLELTPRDYNEKRLMGSIRSSEDS